MDVGKYGENATRKVKSFKEVNSAAYIEEFLVWMTETQVSKVMMTLLGLTEEYEY